MRAADKRIGEELGVVITDDKEFVAKPVVGETADECTSEELSAIIDEKEFVAEPVAVTVGGRQMSLGEDDASKKINQICK